MSESKSQAAFRTISEVAEELGVQQHVLRFWETKFSQIKPMKRGGGRRYYRPEDVAMVRKIHSLLYVEGYTIKGVQKLLKGTSKSRVMAEQSVERQNVDEISLAQVHGQNLPRVTVSPAHEFSRSAMPGEMAAELATQLSALPKPAQIEALRSILQELLEMREEVGKLLVDSPEAQAQADDSSRVA